MELFYRLVIDGGLVVILLLSTVIGGILVSTFWRGLVGLQSLSLSWMKNVGFFCTISMVVPSFSPVFISSYFYINIIYVFNHEFNYLDITLVSFLCFLGTFTFMGGDTVLDELEILGRDEKQEYYQQLWSKIELIDRSLTPVIIITSLITSGSITSCYFNSLN